MKNGTIIRQVINQLNQIDFNSLSVDFNNLRTDAQQSGLYLPASGSYGYHIVFSSDGTYKVYTVTNAQNRKGWSVENGCENLYQKISQEFEVCLTSAQRTRESR